MLILFSTSLTAQNADYRWLKSINSPVNPGLDRAMRFTSETVAPVVIAVPAGILLYNMAHQAAAPQKYYPLIIEGAVITTSTLCLGLKYGVHRTRPYVTYPDIEQRTNSGPYSFPSSHTANSFALATSLTLCYPHWYVAVPAYAYACTIAFSRMRLGVHYPSDVLVGALIGSGCAFLSWEVGKWYSAKQH